MIQIRWYERLTISLILCSIAFIVWHFGFKTNGWIGFSIGSFGWQVIDQIVYTIRFRRL